VFGVHRCLNRERRDGEATPADSNIDALAPKVKHRGRPSI